MSSDGAGARKRSSVGGATVSLGRARVVEAGPSVVVGSTAYQRPEEQRTCDIRAVRGACRGPLHGLLASYREEVEGQLAHRWTSGNPGSARSPTLKASREP
jgi:hypothetical protein